MDRLPGKYLYLPEPSQQPCLSFEVGSSSNSVLTLKPLGDGTTCVSHWASFFVFSFLFFFSVNECFPCMYVYVSKAYQKKASHLGLALEMGVSCYVSAKNQIQVLCRAASVLYHQAISLAPGENGLREGDVCGSAECQ